MKSLSSSVLRLAIPVLLSVAAAGSAPAQTNYYWDGNGATTGTGTLTLAGTWGGASASAFWGTSATGTSATTTSGPGVLDTAIFTANDGVTADNYNGSYTVSLGASESVAALQINGATVGSSNTGGTLTLATGANTLTIGSGGITLNGSNGDPSITGALVLGASQTWTITNAHVLKVGASVTGSATAGNTDTLTLGNVGQYNPNISGVIGDGSAGGNVALTVSNNNNNGQWQITNTANTYTGATSVTSGIVQFATLANAGANSSFGAATGANSIINLGSGTTTGTIVYTGGTTSSSNRGFNLAGTTGGGSIYNTGTGTLNLSGNVTSAGGTNTLTLGGTNTTVTNTFSGLVSDSSGTGAGTTSLNVTGSANWNISNSNTIAGTFSTTNLESTYSGTLTMNGNNTFNNANTDVTVTGGNVTMNGSNSFAGNIAVSGGTLTLGGANSGFGNYNVTGGILNLNSNNDGVGQLNVSGGGAVSIGANGSLASATITLNNGFLLLGGAGNVDSSNGLTIEAAGGGIGVSYTPTSFPTFNDQSGTTGGVFGIGYTGTGGIGSVTNITNLFGSSSYWSLGAFTASASNIYTGTSLPVGAGNTYRLGGGTGTLTVQNAFLTGASNNLIIGTASSGGTVNLPSGETYGGTTSIINGIAGITAGSSFGTAPATTAISLGSGTNAVGINYLGTGETISRPLNFAGTTGSVTLSNSGTGNLVYSGTPTFTGVGAKTLFLGNTGDTYGGSIGALTNAGTGVLSVTKSGAANSVWALTGGSSNTYTGNTTVAGGVLQTTNVTDLANSYVNLTGTSTADPGIWQTQGTITRALSATAGIGNINMNEYGGFAAYGGVLNLNFGNGAALTWGTGFANGSSGGTPAVFGSTTSNNQVNLQNNLSLGTNDPFQQFVYVYKGTGGDSTLFSGVISNGPTTAAASGITKTGLGTLILSNSNNSYSGFTNVGQGTLVAGNNVPAAGAGVTGAFGSGDGPSAAPSTTYATISLGYGSTGASANPTLLIGGAYTVARPISITDNGTNNVYAVGGSTDATSIFSAPITFTLAQGATGNTFDVTQVATSGTDALNITGGITAASLLGTQTVTFANVGAVNVNTTGISNGNSTLAVLQSGPGTTTLAATNTYTGGTSVSGGNLSVTGSTSATGTVAVGGINGGLSMATLSGNGTIGGALTTSALSSNVGHLAPGVNTVGTNFGVAGTLTVAGALTIGSGTALDIDLSSSTTSGDDLITMTGTGAKGVLTIGGAVTVNFNALSTLALGTPTSNDYTLIGGAVSNVGLTAGDFSVGTMTGSTDTAHFFVSGSTLEVYFTSSAVVAAQSIWNTNGNGSWGTVTGTGSETFGANWGATQGSPGLNLSSTGVDTATFGPQSAGTIAVSLNGAAPNLNSITFSSPATNYTLQQNDGVNAGANSITLSQGVGAPAPTINVTNPLAIATAGTQTISAPIILGASTGLNVAANQTLVLSNAISSTGTYGLSNSGAGTTILSNASGNSYSGGTTITAGKFYVTNTSGSGTGSGAVGVSNSGTVLAGGGKISGAVTLTSGASLYSGGVASGTPAVGPGTGMTLSSTLTVNASNLTFALGAGDTGGDGYHSFGTPNTNTTYLTLSGSTSINFVGTNSISLVDLTSGSLALRQGTPYLLISAGSDAAYTDLVTMTGSGASAVYTLDGNGYVVGVAANGYTGGSGLNGINGTDFTPININQYGPDGVTPLASNLVYPSPVLFLNNGNLEVVPEPGTWALMLGGLALLIVIQRRRSNI